MRLKSIKLAGFKSFVDPTTVNFPSNMCSVVGPNGCGKSNIIDAVRWVLGESSAKNLRGEAMTDVIFNGTTHRQPVGQASIELIFDNTSGKLVGEYAAYSEISVRRVVGREGTSEYWLNGAKCRRRDITDLFLGTGLGPRSYAIIEQGMISRLIESKPEELRIFIEEAAGISKYKERRRETESRMRRTLENLDRLADLREELERNLQHLLRQSQAAEKYAEFRAEERELKSQLLGLQWREFQQSSKESQQALADLDIKQEAERAAFERVGADIEGTRVSLAEATDAFNSVQADYYSVGGEVTRVEQALKYEQERRATIESDLLQTREGLQESKGHLNADTERLGAWRAELESLRPLLVEQRGAADTAAGLSAAAEEAMTQWQSRWDEFNQSAAGPKQASEVQQSRIVYLEQVLQRIHERGGKLRKELEALAEEDVDKDLPELEAQIRDGEEAVKAQEAALLQLDAEVTQQRENIERLRDEQDQVRARVQQLKGQEASLQALQEAALAEGDVSATQQWLADMGLDSSGNVYEALQVQDQWSMAVECVLAARLTGVCTQSFTQVQAAFGSAPAGASILAAGEVGTGAPGTLAEKVVGPASVLAVLAGVHIAADLVDAQRLLTTLADTASVITPEGDWLGYGWASKPSKSDAGQGIILRKASLDAVAAELAELEASLQTINQTLAELQESRRGNEDQRRAGEATLKTTVQDQAAKVTERGARVAAVEQTRQRTQQLQADLADSGAQFETEQTSLAAARSELQTAIDQMALDGEQRSAFGQERDKLNSQLQTAREGAREARDNAHRTDVRVQSLDSQVETVASSIARLEQQVEQLQGRVSDLAEQLPVGDNPDAELQSELETLLAQRVDAETALTAARQRVSDNDHALREQEKLKLAAEHRLQALYSELESGRLRQAERNVRIENLEGLLRELEVSPQEVVERLPEDASEPEWQVKVERVAARIARLGPINLAAIDEYAKASERKTYLDAQDADLQEALQTLEGAIRKIDKETRSRFKETFEQINSGFAELFPRVFGGGTANLEMTGDDLLDTGVAIMARPPGKKNSTIHLLSGGEKAMTAIALVFSIFQLNPAPFCMLDEVDAPLDDANVGRYARMVKEMSERVQFIFITHNKITMEAANHLMGVTMHEPGVSRLVTVDIEEAAQLAAS